MSRKSSNSLVDNTLQEMKNLKSQGNDSWLSRVDQIANILNIPQNIFFSKASGKKISALLKSKFDSIFLDKLNEIKSSSLDTLDHNKLRTYRTFKSSFTREPYIDLIRNRNQRCFLSRLRTGSHNLRVELGRHTRPITPFDKRTCQYCPSNISSNTRVGPPAPSPSRPPDQILSPPPDTKFHFLMECPLFSPDRTSFFQCYAKENYNFQHLSLGDKFKVVLCPTNAISVKLVHRFIKSMFVKREKVDELRQQN